MTGTSSNTCRSPCRIRFDADLVPVAPASVGAYVSTACDRRQYRKALELRARGGAGIRMHAIYDGCWSFVAGQFDEAARSPKGGCCAWSRNTRAASGW